jgi:hypothetical protein
MSEKTITGTKGQDLDEYKKKLTANEKFIRYTTWNSTDWKRSERRDELSYKIGAIDFHHYEECELWTIDNWHPIEFYTHHTQKILWDKNFYEKVISIQVGLEHKEFLLKNQITKSYSLDFDNEYQCQAEISTMFKDILLTIPFDSFFDRIQYLNQISKLDTELDLELDLNLVDDLWKLWFSQSSITWKK